ncbi:MAG: FMN-binding glutamate synthase family protein, partial [Planctomycetaceae bacterium]|nr:FMN-binding glutamate synthase family protein [Planctomycetaceae bacterium]
MWIVIVIGALIVLTVIYDLCQRKHTILRNYPIVGHFRYWLERFGPELRQYIVTNNNEERPFSRDQRRWVYASAKQENNYFGFGTDKDLELSPNHLVIKHAAFPISSLRPEDPAYDPLHMIDVAKILGGYRDRKHKFRPKSVISVSAMSFGSLSATAVESLNRGCQATGCLHNTGEGGISPYHLKGGNLIWQLGTGYFGARNADGTFSQQHFLDAIEQARGKVKAIEIKLSQGAKPGLGGMLPAAKVSPEIAKIRDIPVGKDCASPASHSAFANVDEMLDFVEQLADVSGLPVGIKSAVGETEFWDDLINQVQNTDRCVDFITIDGSEGGTGAAPLAFSDHVALPFKQAFASVFKKFELAGIAHNIVFGGSGKLGFPEISLLAIALGCDMINVAREPMLAIG